MSATVATNLMSWFSASAMQSLGWALVHFLWQGTALAAMAAAAMALCRRPSARYAVGIVALALMMLAPVATYFFFHTQQSSGLAETQESSPIAAVATPIARGTAAVIGSTKSFPLYPSRNALPWLVEAWLVGVALFSLRSFGGFLLIERERRRQCSVVEDRILEMCYTLQDQLGIDRAIRFCESAWLQAPAVIGWFRPIVLLPMSVLTGLSEEQLRSVIAHELAHIRRLDSFVNIFQVCVETLLFYHPAVWWMNRRIRAEREHCCDEMAVSLCGNPVEYARALALMEEWRGAPIFAMAANRGPLSERIVHLLGLKAARGVTHKVGLAGSMIFLGAALLAGNLLYGIAYPKPTAYASPGPIARFLQGATPHARPTLQAAPTPAGKPSAAQAQERAEHPVSAQSYIDGMKSAGLTDLSADDLIALKIQGVTPEYVKGMHDLGLHPDAEGLVGMKVQGVTPEYIKELRSLGFTLDEEQIVNLKVQGVTGDYVRGLKDAGIQGDADDIIGMKVQGVTPDYVRQLRATGLKVDSNDVIGLKVQGVTPAYVQGLKDQGLQPDTDEVIGMRVQGVTPEYIRDIRALGLSPSAQELVGMKVQGVTPEYIKTLQSAGFKARVEDIIGARVQGITPEFIDLARKHGFQNLTIEKLIELKHLEILDSKGTV